MFSNRLAYAALGVACVAASGVGAYLATRQNISSAAVPAAAAASASTAVPVAQAAVQESQVAVPAPAPAPRLPSSARTNPVPRTDRTRLRRIDAPVRQSVRKPDEAPAAQSEQAQPADQASQAPGSNAQLAAAAPSFEPLPLAPQIDRPSVEIAGAPEPPARTFQELVVAADSVIGLRTEGVLNSERSRVEDRVEARVVRDVRVNGEVAIPAGARVLGTVVAVERGGRLKERARLGIRFQTLVLADNTRLPISTETIYRYGDAPGNASAAKIGGGAVAGAILGAILGGGKGAAIGATTGAGAGTAAVAGGERSVATFPPGAEVTARILSPITVTVERRE